MKFEQQNAPRGLNGARSRRQAICLAFIFALGVVVAGCRKAESMPPLANSFASKEALVEAVLAGLAAKDAEGLAAIRVTREEYQDLFWPELPESENLPFEFAWSLNHDNSRKALQRALRVYGGQELELVSITFIEPPETYPSFTLYMGARVMVRRISDGAVGELPIFDVFAHRNGRWKLVNYDE